MSPHDHSERDESQIEARASEWEARAAAVRAAKIACQEAFGRPPLSSDLTAALGDTEGAAQCYLRNPQVRTRAGSQRPRGRGPKIRRITLPRKEPRE